MIYFDFILFESALFLPHFIIFKCFFSQRCDKLGCLLMETSRLLERARGTIAGITDIHCLQGTDMLEAQRNIEQLVTVEAKQVRKTFIER